MFIMARIKAYLLMVGAALVAVVGIYFRGKSDGRDELEYEHTDNRINDLLEAKRIEEDVKAFSDDDVTQRAYRWVRENDSRK